MDIETGEFYTIQLEESKNPKFLLDAQVIFKISCQNIGKISLYNYLQRTAPISSTDKAEKCLYSKKKNCDPTGLTFPLRL